MIGLGFAGLTLGLTLSEVGYSVYGIDKRPEVIATLRNGKAHFFERGLDDMLKREIGNRLQLFTEIPDISATIYIITVGTPIINRVPQMDDLRSAAEAVGKVLKRGDLVTLRSTVPIRTTRTLVLPLLEQISGLRAGSDFFLAFAPERTVEGRALQELRSLPQIIGGLTSACVSRCSDLFRTFSPHIIAVESLEAAEFIKAVNNSYRDITFALANEIALMCHQWNLDAHRIIKAANLGYPRSSIPQPSPGVGGYCLTKDPHLLVYSARQVGVEPRLTLAAREVNEAMPHHVAGVVENFYRTHGKSMPGSKVLLLGIAFKGRPETSDLRFSPSLDVAALLREKGCRVSGYDPQIGPAAMAEAQITPAGLYDGFANADAVVVMNNNPHFETLPVHDLLKNSADPVLFYDTWRLFSPEILHVLPKVRYATLGYRSGTSL